jgi:hypothetical protein
MEFKQWKIEVKNNAKNIADKANLMAVDPLFINQPKIDDLKAAVQALQDMYVNIKDVEP